MGSLVMIFRGTLAALLLFAAAAEGCSNQAEIPLDPADSDTGADSDTDADTDTDSATDTASDTDTGTGIDDQWVGTPCDPPDEEGEEEQCAVHHPEAFCLWWEDAPGGLCTKLCEPATYEEPVQSGCPSFEGFVCTDISHITVETFDDEGGYAVCLEECVPGPLGEPGPCQADYIRCDPYSWSFESQFATCLMSKCESDADCPETSGPSAVCDTASGRCTWPAGDPTAEPGDPCETEWDCGANSTCMQPEDVDGKIVPANGYCTSFGCKAANADSPNGSGSASSAIQDEFSCGPFGVCHAGFQWGGMCLKRCDPTHDQDDYKCRQQCWDTDVLDQNGDYECYDTTSNAYPIWTSNNLEHYNVAIEPWCYVPQRCPDNPDDCPDMMCRDPETGLEDTDGYCLDSTTSGPTEEW
jgi:hypothetical protein